MKKLLALSLAAFLLTGCAEMFQAKVDMLMGIGGGSLSGMLSDKAIITELAVYLCVRYTDMHPPMGSNVWDGPHLPHFRMRDFFKGVDR